MKLSKFLKMLPLVLAELLLSPGLPAPVWENLELLCHDMPCKKEKVTERGYDTEKNKNTENKVSQKVSSSPDHQSSQ